MRPHIAESPPRKIRSSSTFLAVDVSGRWPAGAHIHRIARVVEDETKVPLDQTDVYDY
jgi:hypothetical protein